MGFFFPIDPSSQCRKQLILTFWLPKENLDSEVLCKPHAGDYRVSSISLVALSIYLVADLQVKPYIESTLCCIEREESPLVAVDVCGGSSWGAKTSGLRGGLTEKTLHTSAFLQIICPFLDAKGSCNGFESHTVPEIEVQHSLSWLVTWLFQKNVCGFLLDR